MMHRRHADRGSIEPANRTQAGSNVLEAGNAKLRRSLSRDRSIAIDDSNKLNIVTSILKLAIDTEVIAPKGSDPDDSNPQWTRTCHLFDRRFDSLAAPRIQLEQVRHLVIRLRRSRHAKARGPSSLAADIGLCSDKLQQIERDIFRAPRRCGGFHELVPHFSLADLNCP
jgi:hypothetical protein